MQGAEDGGDRLFVGPLALEGKEAVVQGFEVLACVLEKMASSSGETWKSDILSAGPAPPLFSWS